MGVKNVRTLAKSTPLCTFKGTKCKPWRDSNKCRWRHTSRPRCSAPAPTSYFVIGTRLLGIWMGALIRDAATIEQLRLRE
jgi:hypothetical protein